MSQGVAWRIAEKTKNLVNSTSKAQNVNSRVRLTQCTTVFQQLRACYKKQVTGSNRKSWIRLLGLRMSGKGAERTVLVYTR